MYLFHSINLLKLFLGKTSEKLQVKLTIAKKKSENVYLQKFYGSLKQKTPKLFENWSSISQTSFKSRLRV